MIPVVTENAKGLTFLKRLLVPYHNKSCITIRFDTDDEILYLARQEVARVKRVV